MSNGLAYFDRANSRAVAVVLGLITVLALCSPVQAQIAPVTQLPPNYLFIPAEIGRSNVTSAGAGSRQLSTSVAIRNTVTNVTRNAVVNTSSSTVGQLARRAALASPQGRTASAVITALGVGAMFLNLETGEIELTEEGAILWEGVNSTAGSVYMAETACINSLQFPTTTTGNSYSTPSDVIARGQQNTNGWTLKAQPNQSSFPGAPLAWQESAGGMWHNSWERSGSADINCTIRFRAPSQTPAVGPPWYEVGEDWVIDNAPYEEDTVEPVTDTEAGEQILTEADTGGSITPEDLTGILTDQFGDPVVWKELAEKLNELTDALIEAINTQAGTTGTPDEVEPEPHHKYDPTSPEILEVTPQTTIQGDTTNITTGRTEIPAFCKYAATLCLWLDWTMDEGDDPAHPDMPMVEVDLDALDDSPIGGGGSTCPVPIEISMQPLSSETIEFEYTFMCELAIQFSFFVTLIGYMSAAFILTRA